MKKSAALGLTLALTLLATSAAHATPVTLTRARVGAIERNLLDHA
jgi:hypothetical protein